MPDCHCTCLQYVHKHCLCEKCNGKAVCKHTESHHWKKANAEARATQALIWQQESSHYMPSTELQSCSVNESSAGGVESGGTSTSSNDCTEQQASDACTSTSDASEELAENDNALLDLGPSILDDHEETCTTSTINDDVVWSVVEALRIVENGDLSEGAFLDNSAVQQGVIQKKPLA